MLTRRYGKYTNGLKSGCRLVVDADIKSYFDRIPHDRLLLSVRSRVIDRSVVKLIRMWLEAGVMEEMQVRKEMTGTPFELKMEFPRRRQDR